MFLVHSKENARNLAVGWTVWAGSCFASGECGMRCFEFRDSWDLLSASDETLLFCDGMDSDYFQYSNASNGIVFTTSESGKRLVRTEIERREGVVESASSSWTWWGTVDIEVDLEQSYQTLLGFGGAFTDAVGINFQKMNPMILEAILEGYYGDSGIGYSFGRIPIASCDFSTSNYTYDDVEGDGTLL